MADTAKYPESVTKKYDVSGKLQPAKTIFGAAYGKTSIDLAEAPVEVIDDFVKKYPQQPYFKLKTATAAAVATPVK